MICQTCGNNNKNGSKYCENCGTLLKNNKNKETSLILGIICIISSFFIGMLNFVPGIMGIIYSIKNKKNSGKYGIGFVLSIIGMIISLLMFLLLILFFVLMISNSEIDNHGDYSNNAQNGYVYKIKKY